MAARKLAELWENAHGDYHLRVEVGAFQRGLTGADLAQAEDIALYEVLEVLRKIVAEADADALRVASDDDVPRA